MNIVCNFTDKQAERILKVVARVAANNGSFEYPSYGGLDYRLADKLTTDQVDNLQYLIDHGDASSIHEVKRALVSGF